MRTASLTLSLALVACGGGTAVVPDAEAPSTDVAVPTPSPADHPGLNAVLWTQTAAEYRAAAMQTYRGAVARLDEGLADPGWTAAPEQEGDFGDLPPAVILDLDETVLDNSPYQAWLIAADGSYDADTWAAWCEARQARAVPGALDFVRAAVDRGVAVFFVSNRAAESEVATRDNLEALGFGFALADGYDNVLLAHEQPDWGSAKGTRRAVIAAGWRVVLSVGDNLGDFVDGYKVSTEERDTILEANDDAWGTRWIVLPNPQYGSWEGALFGFDWSLSGEAIDARKVDALEAWTGP